jgi:ribosome-binding factor A
MHRQEKMAARIQKILADVISRDLKDPRVALSNVTVSRVEVSSDVSVARVYFSILEEEAKREEIMQALKKAKGFFRSELAKDLTIRYAPALEFKLDQSIERGMRIIGLLNDIGADLETDGQPENAAGNGDNDE